MDTSPHKGMQDLERHITAILKPLDTDELDQQTKKLTRSLKQIVIDTRLDTRDYEYSETKIEQTKYAVAAKNRLKQIEMIIVNAPEVFDSIDTAHVLAKIEHIHNAIE